MTAARSSGLAPVSGGERVALIDALRGFALLGILVVNVTGFKQPFQAFWLPADPALPWYDAAAKFVVAALAEGKFYALFSLLFGLGLSLQVERARARGVGWRLRYARRLLVLFAFGLAHGVLVWAGDILMLYAAIGFVLLPFATASMRTVMVWIVMVGALLVLIALAGAAAIATPEAHWMSDSGGLEAEIADAAQVYATGSFAEITAQRIEDLQLFAADLAFMAPSVLFYFLLGLYLGRRGVFARPADHVRLFAGWLWLGTLGGLPLGVAYAATAFATAYPPGWIDIWSYVAFLAGGLALSLGYAGAFGLLWLRPRAQRVLATLAPVGRMALTNYLLQSIVGTLIFYGYGLGLFGQVSASGGLAIALGIYAVQVPLSRWWLARLRFGPAEWLWRSLTYAQWQPMRVPSR